MSKYRNRVLVRQAFEGLALLAIAWPSVTFAQEAPGTEGMGSAEDQGDIVVTANRREERLQDVPASVQAFGSETLTERRIERPEDLVKVVPGLTVTNPYGEGNPPVFVLRGMTANDTAQTQTRPIALYVDDALRAGSTFEAVPFFDLERVEVLKGPQGALYGRNATAGAVRIISKTPGFDPEGYVTLGYGAYDARQVKAAVQAPLVSDVLAARIAFAYSKNDGYVKNLFPGGRNEDQTDIFAGRLSFYFEPSSSLDATLRLTYNRSGGASASVYPESIVPAITGGFTREGLGFFEEEASSRSRLKIETFGVNYTMNFRPSEAYTITSVTAADWGEYLVSGDEDGLPVTIAEADYNVENARAFFQEVRVASSYGGSFNWLAGIDYAQDKLDTSFNLALFTDPRLGLVDPFGLGTGGFGLTYGNFFTQKRTGGSAFVRAELEILPAIRVSAGGRYSRDTVRVSDYNSGFASDPGSRIIDTPLFPALSRKGKFDNWSFEAGVDWTLAEDVHAYANFKQGYRSGSINARAFFSPSEVNVVKPETANSYEIGLKSVLFDRKLTLNLAGFYVDYSNQQVLNSDPTTTLASLYNVDSRIYGFEVGADLKISSIWRAYGALTLLDPKYRSGSELNVQFDLNGDPVTGTGISIAGNQLLGAAKKSFVIGSDLTLGQIDAGEITIHGDAIYTSRTYFDGFQNRDTSMEGYWTANGRLSLEGKSFSISAWAKNILKKEYFTYMNDYRTSTGYIYARRGAPRTYGIEFSYRF